MRHLGGLAASLAGPSDSRGAKSSGRFRAARVVSGVRSCIATYLPESASIRRPWKRENHPPPMPALPASAQCAPSLEKEAARGGGNRARARFQPFPSGLDSAAVGHGQASGFRSSLVGPSAPGQVAQCSQIGVSPGASGPPCRRSTSRAEMTVSSR